MNPGHAPAAEGSGAVPLDGVPAVVVVDRRSTPVDPGAGPDADLPGPAELAELLARALALQGFDATAEAGLHLVDPSEIAALNAEHLAKDGPTDVLSFPLDGADGAGAPGPSGEGPGGVEWLLGDVVLCPEVAVAQAAGHAGTPADELRLLVVHGALHLCGWDHAEPEERAAMWAREREVMTLLGVAPSSDPWEDA